MRKPGNQTLHLPSYVGTLGEAVYWLRTQRGLTLRALAAKVGVTAAFLCDLEHGRRKTSKLEALARALGVDADELLQLANVQSAKEWVDDRLSADMKEWIAATPGVVALLKALRRCMEAS